MEGLNATLRFGLELLALAALGYWGFAQNDGLVAGLLFGLGAPLFFGLAWGTWVAPKARYRLADPLRLLLEIALFALAAGALLHATSFLPALILTVAVVGNISFMFVLGQRRPGGI